MRTLGYTRPRFTSDDTTVDADELSALGAAQVVIEDGYRGRVRRAQLIADLKPGDVLIVTSLDRLDGRLDGLIRVLLELRDRGIEVRCGGRALFASDGDPAGDLLRDLVAFQTRARSQATREGMQAGNRPGRPSSLSENDLAIALELRRLDRSIGHIARVLGLSASAVQRALAPDSEH